MSPCAALAMRSSREPPRGLPDARPIRAFYRTRRYTACAWRSCYVGRFPFPLWPLRVGTRLARRPLSARNGRRAPRSKAVVHAPSTTPRSEKPAGSPPSVRCDADMTRICCTANFACRRSRVISRLSRSQANRRIGHRPLKRRLLDLCQWAPPAYAYHEGFHAGERWHGLLGVDFFNRVSLQAPR